MAIAMQDLQTVLFALNLAAARGNTLDPEGSRPLALWEAVLPLSMPECGDPTLKEAWRMLVTLSQSYARLAEAPLMPRPNTSIDTEEVPMYGAMWH